LVHTGENCVQLHTISTQSYKSLFGQIHRKSNNILGSMRLRTGRVAVPSANQPLPRVRPVPSDALISRANVHRWSLAEVCGYHRKHRLVCNSTDYVATASDEGVLKLNPRTDLTADEITNVFGYPRDLTTKVECSPAEPISHDGMLQFQSTIHVSLYRYINIYICNDQCRIVICHQSPCPQYQMGKVIGAGSFGVVRDCIEVLTAEARNGLRIFR